MVLKRREFFLLTTKKEAQKSPLCPSSSDSKALEETQPVWERLGNSLDSILQLPKPHKDKNTSKPGSDAKVYSPKQQLFTPSSSNSSPYLKQNHKKCNSR